MFLRIIGFTVLAMVVLLAVALQGVPRVLGGTSLTVLTGSMQPAINPGDVVAIRAIDPKDVHIGDVITFQPVSGDPALITHRVISKGASSMSGLVFETQGDANNASDHQIVGEQIRGVVMYTVPYLGYVLSLAGNSGSIPITVVGIGLLVFAVYALLPRRKKPAISDRRRSA